ncbi:hypothetical protein V6N13_146830 [Hibiscus sabdariffa]
MAEGEKEKNTTSEESVKLFVGQVPKHMTESQVLEIFEEFALVDEVNIIKDKATHASRGCCFVICPSREEADKAVNAFHNKKTLPGLILINLALVACRLKLDGSSNCSGMLIRVHAYNVVVYNVEYASSPLQVKYADGELERLEHKLFVGMLPKNVSEAEVAALFSKYGTIKDLQIIRGSQQTSKGCAFLKYETKEQALDALQAINGKHNFEGSSVPLVVKWADTEKERQARRAQKAQFEALNKPNADSQHPSLFGALPMGYVPPYNGYGYQNQPAFHNMIPPVNQGSAFRGIRPGLNPNIAPRNYAMPPGSYVGSGYPGLQGLQYPMASTGGIMSHLPLTGSPGSMQQANTNSNSSSSSSVGTSSGGQIEGPPGANLFIYHIPQEFGDQELANAFQGFGRVLSAKVFIDKATGASKCFGFVSYDSPAAAQDAINTMNGCQLGGKKLKVQLKRDNK